MALINNLGSYDTSLSPQEETQFQAWKQRYAPRDSGEDYDLRGAFKAGFTPNPSSGHWPDTFKKPNHPTFSDQSVYAKNRPELAGSWNGDTYVPSKFRQTIDGLSSEELDLLNNDPKMLSDFRTKYATPAEVTPSLVGKMASVVAPMLPEAGLKDIGQNVMGGLSALKTGFYDVPKALVELPSDLAQGKGPNETTLGQLTNAGVEGIKASIPTSPSEAVKAVAEHPVSTAMLFSGLGADMGPESGLKGFAEELSSNADSKLASLNKKLALIPTKATQLKGYNQPIPSSADLATGTENVIKAMKQVVDDHGELLNQAKKEAGIPATKEEIDFSNRRYGNPFGVNLNKPLELPEPLAKTPTYEGPSFLKQIYGKTTHMSDQLDQWAAMYRDDPALAKQSINEVISRNTNNGDKVGGWFKTPEIATQFKQELISALEKGKGASGFTMTEPESQPKPMPFQIGTHDTPEQLQTEINRFKANQSFITAPDKIKAATYLQDQIQQQGVFRSDIAKGPTMGRLKGSYGDLADIIKENSPALQSAKSKFADLMDKLSTVKDKINPDKPGATQSYLRRLFTSDSPSTQDDLKQLAYLEKLSGKPVVTNLFKQFAGQAFDPLVSRPGREIMEATGGVASAALGHPAGLFGAGALLAAQSPRILGSVESAMSKILPTFSKYGPSAALQTVKQGFTPSQINPDNGREMQSLKDRLNNARKH